MGFHHVGQAGPELLTSGDSSASASQSAGITDVSHHAWPKDKFLVKSYNLQSGISQAGKHSLHGDPRQAPGGEGAGAGASC